MAVTFSDSSQIDKLYGTTGQTTTRNLINELEAHSISVTYANEKFTLHGTAEATREAIVEIVAAAAFNSWRPHVLYRRDDANNCLVRLWPVGFEGTIHLAEQEEVPAIKEGRSIMFGLDRDHAKEFDSKKTSKPIALSSLRRRAGAISEKVLRLCSRLPTLFTSCIRQD